MIGFRKNRPDDSTLRPSTLTTDASFESTQSGQVAPSTIVQDDSYSSFQKSPESDDLLSSPGGASGRLAMTSLPSAAPGPSEVPDSVRWRNLRQPLVRSKRPIDGSPPEAEVDDVFAFRGHLGSRLSRRRSDNRPSTASPSEWRKRLRQLSVHESPTTPPPPPALPNGMILLSPNGGLGRPPPQCRRAGSEFLLRPRHSGRSKGQGEAFIGQKNAVERMVSLPTGILQTNRTRGARGDGGEGPRPKAGEISPLQGRAIGLDMAELNALTKEELFVMWKASERELNSRLVEALRQKSEMQDKLESVATSS